MIDEVALHRTELRALRRRFHVRRLDLFGSTAGANASACLVGLI
jgi:hypothetical protein